MLPSAAILPLHLLILLLVGGLAAAASLSIVSDAVNTNCTRGL